MRNLSEIVEDVKLNNKPDYDELRYALLVYVSMMNLASMSIREMTPDKPIILAMKKDNVHSMYHKALNSCPKKYLGWSNDPENPEYQKFHTLGNKLIDKVIKKNKD